MDTVQRMRTTATRRRLLGVLTAAALVGTACGGGGDDAAPATEAPGAAADEVEASVADDGVPASLRFSAPLVGGGTLDAADLADKPTAFWFWSPT